jgi:branched-chain amino acid transport system ATP-binding protein
MLDVMGIDVLYGEFQALFGVEIHVSPKESVVILGANGAGKSTLLKAICGLQPPSSGDIILEGESIRGLAPYKIIERGISLVPEGGRIFPNLSVMENLKIGSYVGRSRRAFQETLEEVFSLFPRLRERPNQLADTLSGGERQMLAIARSLMSRPKLILLDEPSSGLAPLVVSLLFDFIAGIKAQGYTILLVEQNVRKALDLCDRAYLLESGHVELKGDREAFMAEERIRKAYLGI